MMKVRIQRVMGFFSRKKLIIFAMLLVSAGGASVYLTTREKKPSYDFATAQRGDIIREVSVTGRVKPSQHADLAFETGGKVAAISVKVGDSVEASQELVALDNAELETKLNQARADLDYANAQLAQTRIAADIENIKLSELKRGTRQEEIQIAETKVSNSEKALDDAKINLANVESKADADIKEDYDSALTASVSSVTVATEALFTLTNIQNVYFYGNYQTDIKIADAKAAAILSLLGGENAGKASNDQISQMTGGAKSTVQQAQQSPTHENIDKALADVKDGLEEINTALNLVPIDQLSSSHKTDLNTEKTNINSEITTISGKQQAIEVQKATNSSAIQTAKAKVNDAENALLAAKDELSLKLAGTTPEQIRQQESQVEKANANVRAQIAQVSKARATVENIQAQMEKTIIRSPIKGIITKQDAKIGEIVAASQIVVSIISANQFEVEANITEADIAKINMHDTAKITLDAYPSDVIFNAWVAKIDPAETIIEGVTTYKTTLYLDDADARVKSGMTANVTILADKREGVISIPQRAIVETGGKKIVRVLIDDKAAKEIVVETGLRGSDGNIEILSGVSEGDRVVTFVREE